MKSLITTLLLITGISMAQSDMPSVPQTTSFQAVITDTLGVPIADGTKTFTFRMEKPTDTGQIIDIWEETQEVEVVNGVISAVLGSITPLNPIPFTGYTFQNTTYNLIISLDGEDISVIPLTSVPFALNASRTNYSAHAVEAEHAVIADTAHFVMATPLSDTSGFAHEAYHSAYTDTSGFTHQSLNSTYADTAHYMNLSNYNYLIRAVKEDDASVVVYSTGENSASYFGLISQTSDGTQRELRIINEGNNGGDFRFYDSSNDVDLMVLDTAGSLTATKFIGNGSELTNITITNFGVTATATELNIMDGVTATTEEINYVDGVTAAIQTQMDGKQPLDPDLTDLSDGTLSASLVEHGSYFISSNGNIGEVWTSDGSYAGHWLDPYATTLGDLGLTANAAELNIMDGVTATNDELNIIDGVTATTAELNYVSGVSSAIQTQIDGKQPLDSDLTDLSDGTLSSSLVEHGSYFIPSAGTSGQVWTSDGAGAGAWASTAITTLPTLDVTATATELNIMDGVTATAAEINFVDGVTSAVQTQIDAKQATVTGAASSIVTDNLTASRAVIAGANGKVAVSDVTSAELGYVDGVTSAIQTQLDGKQALDTDLTDLADGTLSASKVENGSYFISSEGVSGRVWTSDGAGAGAWVASTAASELGGLSDALIETNSMYIGNDPASTTNAAQYNLAVGTTALDAISTGDNNVAVGYNALTANTTAGGNTALGSNALKANTGTVNTAVGYNALLQNTSGSENTAIGDGALYTNTTGEKNNAMGTLTLGLNTSGDNNVAAGNAALYANTTGSNNTALGYQAGNVITNGNSNVILGSNADPGDAGGTNQIVIGYGATGHGDNIAVIGNGSLLAIHPHDDNEVDLGSSNYEYKDLYVDGTANVDVLNLNGTAVTANAAELNIMDGVTATTVELNKLAGATATTAQLNYVNGVTSAIQTQLDAKQAINANLTDLVDGTLTATTVQYGSYFISTAGTDGQVWTSDGTGAGAWEVSASTVGGLSDALVEDNSMYIGNDPASTTSSALKNVAIGTTALDAITGGDNNVAVGYDALTANNSGSKNTALGFEAGDVITTGSENVILGSGADPSAAGAANQIVIGRNATGVADNSVTLGNASVTAVYMAQDQGATAYGATFKGSTSLQTPLIEYTDGTDALTIESDGAVTTAGNLSVGGSNKELRFYEGSNYVGFEAPALSADKIWVLPTVDGSNGQVLSTNGSGTLSWASASNVSLSNATTAIGTGGATANLSSNGNFDLVLKTGNATTGSITITDGASGNIAVTPNGTGEVDISKVDIDAGAIDGTAIGASSASTGAFTTITASTSLDVTGATGIILQNDETITNSTDGTLALTADITLVSAHLSVGGSNNELRFYEGSNYVGFEAPALSADKIWVLPAVDGSSGQVLSTNSSGTLSWATRSSVADATDLSDVLVEATGSIYVGNDPASTTDGANYNTALGTTALDAITTGDQNVAVGYDALTTNTTGAQNTAVGKDALKVNLGGSNNSAFGFQALVANTSADYNSAFGSGALGVNTTGTTNTAVGYAASGDNETGDFNVAIGKEALKKNTDGDYNTAVGNLALKWTSGDGNTAVGYGAADNNTTGDYNIAIGLSSLNANTTAGGNIAIGYQALNDANRTADASAFNVAIGHLAGNSGVNDISTGDQNVLIGYNTAASVNTASNQIVIGAGASGTGNNFAVIGNASVTRLYAAQDGAGVLYADASIVSSDSRVKKDINDLVFGLDYINSLRPVSYYKKDPIDYPQELKDKFYPNGNVRTEIHEINKELHVGFIAQEVKQVNDEMGLENNIVVVDEDGFHRMDYQKIVVPLVKAVQEQQDQIEDLMRKYEELAAQNQKLLDMISNKN